MSVSSDSGTTSSRLRQFGLYRTIDARTEEFLKLSRRRQIRQGCACAAVSTAITVTVVVCVLLVYEYGFHAEPELGHRHRPHWFSMLNDSDASFDKNIQKTSFNINRNTIKILPLLLKALKQNRYLEKLVENSSKQPLYDKETTDYPLVRNIFSDARNWIRMPTHRLYAIEFKSSPVAFFRTRNMEDFAKSAKIMNSQRIKNYIDRMINEKVISYNTKISRTAPAATIASPDSRSKEKSDRTRSQEINKSYCKCDHLGGLLKKLQKTLDQLLPGNEKRNQGSFLCEDSKFTSSSQKTTTRETKSAKIVSKTDPECRTMKGSVSSKCHKLPRILARSESNFTLKPKKSNDIQNMIESIRSMQNKLPHKNVTNILLSGNHQNLGLQKVNVAQDRIAEDTTTIKSYIEPTEIFNLKHSTTKPMKALSERKLDHQVPRHGRFTLKQKRNESDLVYDYLSQKPSTRFHKLLNYEEDTTEIKKSKNHFSHKSKVQKPDFFKSRKKLQIEPMKSFSTEHQENKHESELDFNKKVKVKTKNETESLSDAIYKFSDKSDTRVTNVNDNQKMKKILFENPDNELDFDEKIWIRKYQPKPRKYTTLKQFLHKLEASNKNNLIYFDKSNVKIFKKDHSQRFNKINNAHENELPRTEELFDTLTDFDDVRFNSTYGFYPGSTESLTLLNSMIPDRRSSFLDIRRNHGKPEGYDYDEDPTHKY